MSDVWKQIPSYPLYEASSLGRIRKIGGNVSSFYLSKGYNEVCVKQGDKWVKKRSCRLVAEAFFGPSDLHVDHINSIRNDDKIENLRYATNRQNTTYGCLKRKKTTGAYYHRNKKTNPWQAATSIKGVNKIIGFYPSEQEAHAAYVNYIENTLGEKYAGSPHDQ